MSVIDFTDKRHRTTDACPPDCFGCRAASISFGAAATPNRRVDVVKQSAWEDDVVKDMSAYKRLKGDGKQPRSVQGAADVEKFANSDFEVTSGYRLSTAKVGAKYDETQKFLQSPEGLVPITPREPTADQ